MVNEYLKSIASVTKRGDAREESYYSALATFLQNFSDEKRKKKIHVTILPKKTEAGNPDFRIWDGKHSQVGYIEAKHPGANLDEVETGDQLKRYIQTFPNLILTNFYEFRLYQHGKQVVCVHVARPFIAAKLKLVPHIEHQNEFFALLEKFLQFSLPTKFTAESLAKELASRTRFLRDQIIKEELREASSQESKKILGFYEAFQKHLIANLKADEFADLYAQTITYGLFAARTRANGLFNRRLAYDLIPKTIGILRDIFHFISFDPPEQLQATVDDIAEVLAVADVKEILHEYFQKGKGSDPIFHFYETFLAQYNPRERERRGVYYTPEPVVSYIVRSLNILLKEQFNRSDGLATSSVTLLDPAGGTLTFLAEAAKLAVNEYVGKYGEGSRSKFIEDHILKHFYAFELMMAPYAAGHLKMGFLLEELGHKLTGNERFQFYLTNTLEMEELTQTTLPGMSSLSEESHLAGKVKRQEPILVVLGNPPYSGHSANKGDWIADKIETYKFIDGKALGEKNSKWLQDDYVKFIRFAQWKIDQINEGILGFITNHSYLDNPTFRGMRQSLMSSFDEIYILDLHGNSLKKEQSPDGSTDENVFDIQQGVAIGLFVKKKGFKGQKKIFHAELWGDREEKYHALQKLDITKTKWKQLKPSSPFYFFVPRNEKLLKKYQSYPHIQDIFQVTSVGAATARDHLTIHHSSNDVWNTVRNFALLDPEIARSAYQLGEDVRDWKVKLAQDDLKNSGLTKEHIVPILYRPFDIRYTYYTGRSKGFHCMPRGEVMSHMLEENLALCIGRAGQVVGSEYNWNLVFCASNIIDLNLFYRGGSQNFPLYLYPKKDKAKGHSGLTMMLFEPSVPYGQTQRTPNINSKIFSLLSKTYKQEVSPESIFFYIYAFLHSNEYRNKYAEFLKSDFPRVPFTTNKKLFLSLANKGELLANLHLLKSKKLDNPTIMFEGKGDNRVEKVSYDEKNFRIYINSTQSFLKIHSDVWTYHIGGYQVTEKWLKDRKGRLLSSDEVSQYCKILSSIAETIKIQKTLDELFNSVEDDLLEIS